MYSNRWYCDSLEYVLENRSGSQVISAVDVPSGDLPEHTYEDTLDWAVWKRAKGYKLYLMEPLKRFRARILGSVDEPIPDGHVRLYRVLTPKEGA